MKDKTRMCATSNHQKRTSRGGAACIYGVLYQILSSLDLALRISLNGSVRGGNLTNAQMVLEPPDGGDLQVCQTTPRRIQQYKTRRSGTWSLRNVLHDILPDLYQAIEDPSPGNNELFEFITDGRQGRWGEFLEFCRELADVSAAQLPNALDDQAPICNIDSIDYTRRRLFLEATRVIRLRAQVSKEPEPDTQLKLHYLLSRFHFEPEQTEEVLLGRIDSFLKPLIDRPEDLQNIRNQLVGILLEGASHGRFEFTANDLFSQAGIQGRPTNDFDGARKSLAIEAKTFAINDLRYIQDHDVRTPLDWPATKRVLVFSGDSGQGKSWRLAQTVLQSPAGLPILQRTWEDPQKDLKEICDTVWGKGYERTTQITLSQLYARLDESLSGMPNPWLVTGIDDVHDISHAHRLVSECLKTPGVRLAIATSRRIGGALTNRWPNDVHHVKVMDFTHHELRNYLTKRDRRWGSIPQDVRDTLTRPLLAGLFCDLATDPNWQPTNEYELYEEYWDRISTEHEGPNHPDDRSRLKRLAMRTRKHESSYPWTLDQVEDANLDDNSCKRLETVGWLHRPKEGMFALPHARLLSWLVAQTFADDIVNQGTMGTLDPLSELVEVYWSNTAAPRWRGYVAMDVLWTLCSTSPERAADLLAALDQHFHMITPLYEELLPTLGPRIIAPLRKRLHSISEDDRPIFPSQAAKTMISVLRDKSARMRDQLIEILDDDSELVLEATLITLASVPTPSALDRIWELHKQNAQGLKNKDDRQRFLKYEHSINALKACARVHPEWVEQRISECDPTTEPIGELAYVLASLGPSGHIIWKNIKATLLDKTNEENPRGTITCIRVFSDASQLSKLRHWLGHQGQFVQHAAFAALARIAPDDTLDALQGFPPSELALFANWWLPELLYQIPTNTRNRLHDYLRTTPNDFWVYASLWASCMNAIDIPILETLLDQFGRDLLRYENRSEREQRDHLRRPLMFLNRINRHDLLQAFEQRQGTRLDLLLSKVATHWLPNKDTRTADMDLENARGVLEKIGGKGIQSFLHSELHCENILHRLDVLQRLSVFPPDGANQLLAERVASWKPSQDHYEVMEHQYAVRALAAFGDIDSVIQAILQPESPPLLADVPDWLSNSNRISSEQLQPAIDAIKSENEEIVFRGLCALLVGSEEETLKALPEVLPRWPHNESIRTLTIHLLSSTGPDHQVLARAVSKSVPLKNHPHFAVQLRLAAGDEKSLSEVRAFFMMNPHALPHKLRELATGFAAWHKDTDIAHQIIWPELEKKDPRRWTPAEVEAVALVEHPEANEALWNLAFAPAASRFRIGHSARFYAVQSLMQVDLQGALQAAQQAIETNPKEALKYARLFLKFSDERIVTQLVRVTLYEHTPPSVVRGTAIALRRASAEHKVSSLHEALGPDRTESEQARACYIAGWQGPGFLEEELVKFAQASANDRARSHAIAALERQNNDRHCQNLHDAIQNVTGRQAYTYLQSLIALCHPDILKDSEDRLGLHAFWHDLPSYLQHNANKALKKRAKELQGVHKMENPELK